MRISLRFTVHDRAAGNIGILAEKGGTWGRSISADFLTISVSLTFNSMRNSIADYNLPNLWYPFNLSLP